MAVAFNWLKFENRNTVAEICGVEVSFHANFGLFPGYRLQVEEGKKESLYGELSGAAKCVIYLIVQSVGA